MTRFTRLETAVMAALAHDLRGQVPNLASQFAGSRLNQRRNSGFGLFTEVLVDPSRAPPASGPTGDLGTVHAMITGLRDPVAFKARVRDGVLLGLLGDSYGQDTRAIDFATAHFNQVFTVDERGESIPFGGVEPASPPPRPEPRKPVVAAPQPAPATHRAPPQRQTQAQPHPRPQPQSQRQALPSQKRPAPVAQAAPSANARDLDLRQAYDVVAGQFAAPPPDPNATLSQDEKTSIRVALWVGIFVLGALLIFVFKMSPVFVFIAGMVLGRFFQSDKGLTVLKRGAEELKKAQAKSS